MTGYRERMHGRVRYSIEGFVRKIAEMHGVTPDQLADTSLQINEASRARAALWWVLYERGWSYRQVADVVGAHMSSVHAAVNDYEPTDRIRALVEIAPHRQHNRSHYGARAGDDPLTCRKHVQVTESMGRALEADAQRRGVSESEVIRRAIRRQLMDDYARRCVDCGGVL